MLERGLAENTIRRRCKRIKQFFTAACKKRLIKENPFDGIVTSTVSNPKRQEFIRREDIQKVLDACPNNEWRLIFGLARFGGLRCPSEVLRLKWDDVDFERLRFTVHASKTEHHADSGIRTVPMFPELQPLFQDAFDQAKPGDVYCVTRYRQGQNLAPHARRIVKSAGIEPWPKIFQNCRSSRETELFKLTKGNVKAVCKWIGNSPAVAMQHYAQVTEADTREAAEISILTGAEKTVHNPVHVVQNSVQIGAALSCKMLHEVKRKTPENLRFCDNKPEKTKARDSM
jgi:integrase